MIMVVSTGSSSSSSVGGLSVLVVAVAEIIFVGEVWYPSACMVSS